MPQYVVTSPPPADTTSTLKILTAQTIRNRNSLHRQILKHFTNTSMPKYFITAERLGIVVEL
jgi:hypothetical protein